MGFNNLFYLIMIKELKSNFPIRCIVVQLVEFGRISILSAFSVSLNLLEAGETSKVAKWIRNVLFLMMEFE